MEGNDEGCRAGGAGMGPAHGGGLRGWRGSLTARGLAVRAGAPRSHADEWSGGLLDCLDAQHHVVLSCVRAP